MIVDRVTMNRSNRGLCASTASTATASEAPAFSKRLATAPLAEEDVALARKKLRTEWYRTAADPNALAFQIGHFEVMDSWQTLQTYLEARDQASGEDIATLVDSYFVARNRSVGVVTPEGADE